MASTQIPSTQKAWRVVRRGSPADAVILEADVPVPSDIKEGEVLVKVEAAALNPVGHKLTQLLPNFVVGRPYTAENDLAGVVVKSNSPLHQPGDRVFGIIPVPLQFPSKQGALAQYARLPGSNIVKRPDDMSAVDAAGFALAGETAYVGLFEVCKLEPGQMVFVNGGSSSVGAYAIQLAKAKGLTVWASASGKNEDFVRGLGADKFFDYTQQPLHEAIAADASQPRFHAILDAVGLVDPRLFMMSPAFTTPDAIYAHVGPPTPASLSDGVALVRWVWQGLLCPTALGGTRRKMKIVALQHTAARLQEIGRLVQEGKVRPIVDSVFAFEDVHKAYDRIMTNRAKGKVVVRVDPNA